MLVWEDSYRIGNEEMDSEHLILFAILNQISINIDADMAASCLNEVLGALEAYISYHFAHEEALMRAWGYPGLESHSESHRRFIEDVARMRSAALVSSGHEAAMRLRFFVLDWLLNHILETDADYASFIAAKAGNQ